MIARTPEQSLRAALSTESGADSRFAVVGSGNRGTFEEQPQTGVQRSWGILTSVPVWAVARGRRSEKPHAGPVKAVVARSEPETTLRERFALARWNALARQIAARHRVSPFHLQPVEASWRHALRGYGISHLHCALCRQDEVVPFIVQGARFPPVGPDAEHGGHVVGPDRLRAAGRAAPATQAAARVRLVGARFGAGRFGLPRRPGIAPRLVAGLNGGFSAAARHGGSASTCLPASCGRIGCPRTMCVRVAMGSANPRSLHGQVWARRP